MAITDAQQKLRNLLDAVFEDSVVDRSEHAAILAATESGELTTAQVQQVFGGFMEKKWGEAMKDGVLSPQERLLLLGIMRELKLSDDCIPPMARMALLID